MIFQNELIKSLRANGNHVAIESGETNLTYAALLSASNKVAGVLLRAGTGIGTPVGIVVNDRRDLISSMVGSLIAGCAFVPIDGTLPAKRLTAMIGDLDLRYLIADRGAAAANVRGILPPGIRDFLMEDILEGAETEDVPGGILYPEYNEDDSVYIYFTSGSTGTPKGIIGRNASLLQFINWEIANFGISGGTRVSQFISPYFDAFLRDIFVPLLAGGIICLPPAEEDFFSPEKLVSWIDRSGINLIHCVPSLFNVFNNPSLTAGHFKALRYVLMSGEKINPSGLMNWYRAFDSRIQLVNLYGATETTMIRACYLIRPEDAKATRIPVGSPIADTELLVLDNDLRRCDPLVPGEIYIVSDYITKGYLNNPGLTREKFLTIDMGVDGEKKAFKTGDKGRILPDGQIDLIGREDRQAKLRGIRIELDETESVLNRSEWIKNAVVVKRVEDNGDESLVAYVIKAERAERTDDWQSAVRKELEEYLPAYMIPADMLEVTEYPLLSNGKIDYKTLAGRAAPVPIIAPANDIETKILSIWKEILGDKAISTEDGFHKIGGNSLSIMKLIGRIYKEYKVRISLSDLFNNLTIRKQAEYIKRSGKDSLYVIGKAPVKPGYHLSAAQERMYYNQQLNKDSTAYNLPMAWVLAGDIVKSRIEEVFRSLIVRHESLRTEFRFEKDELLQFVKDHVDFDLEEIRAGQDINQAILAFVRPFHLDKAPLVRCGIIHATDGTRILVVDFHHIICDGISQINLLSDMACLYNGEEPSKVVVQYKDYAEWEYQFRSSEEYLSHREFWLRNFEGDIPRLELPTLRPAIGPGSDRGDNFSMIIPKNTFAPMIDQWRKEEITVFSGFVSLYYLFLSQLTGQEDIVIGIASSGRMQQELENVAGMFVKTLPIRYRIDPDMPFRELVKEINTYLIQAYSKQVYDLTNIVIELNAGRAEPISHLFDVVFVYQNFENNTRSKGATGFSRYPIGTGTAKYPITLYAFEDEGSFGFKWEYSTAYFTKTDIELLSAQFRSVIETVASDPNARIADIIGSREQATNLIEDDISFNF